MTINADHWLLRPTCSEAASVSGGGQPQAGGRTLDLGYIRSLFHDAPQEALDAAVRVIEELLHGRRG